MNSKWTYLLIGGLISSLSVKLHNLSFLRRCLMLDDGFKLKSSVDLKKGRGKRKKRMILVISL